jgi:hypothetical protein
MINVMAPLFTVVYVQVGPILFFETTLFFPHYTHFCSKNMKAHVLTKIYRQTITMFFSNKHFFFPFDRQQVLFSSRLSFFLSFSLLLLDALRI